MKRFNKKKILLFGGSGLIGTRICQLLASQMNIYAPQRKDVDLTKKRQIEKSIFSAQPGAIIYAAGVSSADEAERKKEYATLVNAVSAGIVATAAAKNDIPVVYLSTDAVFRGDQRNRPYREEDSVNPINYYGVTKYMGEKNVLNASSKNCILRLITVYTHDFSGKKDIVRLAIESFREGKRFTGIIDQFVNPTYVDNVVLAINRVIERKYAGIMHIGAKNTITNYEFVKLIAKVSKCRNAEITPITFGEFSKNNKVKRGQYNWLDTKKAQRLLGDDVVLTVQESLGDFWHNFSLLHH